MSALTTADRLQAAIEYTQEMIQQIQGLPESAECEIVTATALLWVAELQRRKAAVLH